MKKLVSMTVALTAGALWASVVPEKQVVAFSSEGPDRYADGSVVADGECYALVWSADGVFEGIGADGKAKDSNDRVVYIGNFALGGKCEPVTFQIPDGLFGGGFFDLWLLDTRVFDNGKVTAVGKKNDKVTVSSAAKAASGSVKVAASGTSTPQSASGVVGGATTSVPAVADVQKPTITGITFDKDAAGNEVVVLEMRDSVAGVRYAASGALSPTMEGATEGQVTSGNGGTIRLIMPKSGSSMFFRGQVK